MLIVAPLLEPGPPMIDIHIHAVPPNLPGTGALAPLLGEPPDGRGRGDSPRDAADGRQHGVRDGRLERRRRRPARHQSHARNRRLRFPVCTRSASPTRRTPTPSTSAGSKRCSRREAVVALKGYLGYLHFEPAHPNYRRYYELAAKYDVPVMFHTGDTYSPRAKLKYAHPLGVDEVAVDHPRHAVRDVPRRQSVDDRRGRSDLQERERVGGPLGSSGRDGRGRSRPTSGREAAEELSHAIQRAIRYSERPNRFLYGTDWPLAPMLPYRDFILKAVPAGVSRTGVRGERRGAVPDGVIARQALLLPR